MKLKSYFADSVELAMGQAAKELGQEAMLVYSREAPPEARYLGAHEVVFALPVEAENDHPSSRSVPEKPSAGPSRQEFPPARSGSDMEHLAQELTALRQQVGQISRSMMRNGASIWNTGPLAESLTELCEELLNADVAAEIVQELAVAGNAAPQIEELVNDESPGDALRRMFRRSLQERLQIDSTIGRSRGGAQVVALVGPPGTGKTSTLVKLAATYALKAKMPAQLLSVDMYRVGAAEQLRAFAAILGLGFQSVETPGALGLALEEHRHKDLILIDTPGHSEKDFDAAQELTALLQASPDIDVHLTVPASMKATDLRKAVDRYNRFQPAKLLFTKLDESASPGSLLSEAIRTNRPVSFLTDGQQIPEDLHEATHEHILDLVFGRDDRPGLDAHVPPAPPRVPASAWPSSIAGQAAAA